MTEKNKNQSAPSQRSPTYFQVDQVKELETDTSATDDNLDAKVLESTYHPIPSASQGNTGSEFARGLRWFTIFLSAASGLIAMMAGAWVYDLIGSLVIREDWIGWLALTLITTMIISVVMIILRELTGLLRVSRVTRLRILAEGTLRQNDRAEAYRVLNKLYSILNSPEHQLAKIIMMEHQKDIHDARELLTLAERELIEPLDQTARELIAGSAKRISIVTAISPAAFVDVLFVTLENLRMLRRLAVLYGCRPGTLGNFKLARMVITHIALTGGVAFTTDLIQQFISTKLTAKLSARLGEGIFNGALTTRIGIAALDLCRPLPFIEAKRPRVREFISAFTRTISTPK